MPTELTHLSEAQAGRLTRFYERAEREILDRLNRALLRGNKTEYLASMKKNIEQVLQQLRAGSRTWCTEVIPRVYVYGATMADRMITEAGFELKSGAGFGAIHQQAAQVLAENAFESLDNVAQAIGRQTEDIYRELALENIRGTVVGYDTWKQSARNFREQLAERGVTGFKDKTGRNWNMRSYAEMVARTTAMEAHNQGTVNRLAENGHDLVIVSSHGGACELCIPWERKVLSISGKTPGYPTLAEAKAAGLFHPRCVHTISLHVDLDEEIKKLEGEIAESSGGPSLPDTEGVSGTILKGLNKALNEALEHGLKTGKECLLIIDSNSGEEVYSKVEGTDDQVVFPQSLVDFLRQAESNSIISIHNHPNSSSFSDADLRIMVQFQSVGSMAVIGHNGTRYTVSVGQGVRPTGTEVQVEWKAAHDTHFSYFNRLVSSGTLKPEDAWKEHTHLIIRDVAKKFGWDYRRVMPDGR